MKVHSAALLLPDGRSFSVRYLLDADELAGLQAVGLIPDHAFEVVGMQDAADCVIAEMERQAYTARGGLAQ